MATILFFLMLLVWLALAVYQDDAPYGCCILFAAPFVLVLMLALYLLVWASSWGSKGIEFHVWDRGAQS